MIDKSYGKFTPVCDGCDECLEPCDTFEEAVDLIKEETWTRGQIGDLCPNCQEVL